MRIVRYKTAAEPARYGWVIEDQVGPLEGSPFAEFRRIEATHSLANVRLLAPVLPSKILCVARNYVAHAKEHEAEVPEVPLIFLKPPTAVIGHQETILLPPQSQQVEHEAELAVVIGKRGRWISPDDALNYLLGYTGSRCACSDFSFLLFLSPKSKLPSSCSSE